MVLDQPGTTVELSTGLAFGRCRLS